MTAALVPWRVPVYLPHLQPALTDRATAQAEAALGVRLPRAYLAALRIQNGGYVRANRHPDYALVDHIAGIGPRFPSVLARDWTDVKRFMKDEGATMPARIDDLVPFCGDGHFHYCFDYRQSGRKREPAVTYIDIESFRIDRIVAPDFAAFLGALRAHTAASPTEPVYGLVTHGRATAVAAAVSTATGFSFEDQGDQDHGFRSFRARLPGRSQWAWLSANRVRRGFVRKTDPDYRQLRKLLPELVDRYPAHSDCGFFLSCSDLTTRSGAALVRGLAKLPFPSRVLQLTAS